MTVPRLIEGGVHGDARGEVRHVNGFGFGGVDRFYTICPAQPCEVRGWVGHQREWKWFYAVSGEYLVGVVQPDDWNTPSSAAAVQSFKLSASQPQILEVPPGCATASMALCAGAMHQQRVHWAGLYSQLLGDVEELILPTQLPNRIHSWHLYVIRLKLDQLAIDRAAVIDALKKAGITTSVHWTPLHMHPYYRDKYGYKPEDLPVAAGLYPQIITLPLFPEMTEEQVVYVCETLKEILAANLTPHVKRQSVCP